MRNDILSVEIVLIALLLVQVSCELLFKKGAYKAHKRGVKVTVTDISNITNDNFPDANYLKVKAKIPVLRSGGVRKFRNLETIKLDSCEIVDVQAGAFSDLPNLKTIGLNDNEIRGIKTGVFNKLDITTLYLHRNKISFIETQAFDDIINLKKLKLNSNFISYWDNNWFKNTPHLSELFVRRNAIRSLPGKAFKNLEITQNSNKNKQRRISVYLSRNLISSIAEDAFSGLTECSQVWLDRNEIREIPQHLFIRMNYMEVLFLSGNFLTNLPKDLFGNLKSALISLDLAHNNNLTCLDYQIVSKVTMTNLEKIHKLNCECVKKLEDKFVVDDKHYEINSDC